METRTLAERLVAELAAENLIVDGGENRALEVVTSELGADRATRSSMPKLTEIVAYLGGALVLAAGLLFALESWDRLGPVGHVIFLAGIAIVLGGAGAIAARSELAGQTARRLTGTLLTGSALAAGLAVGVAIEDFTDDQFSGMYWPGFVGSIVVAVGSAVAYRVASTAVGLVGMLGSALVAAGHIATGLIKTDYEPMSIGVLFFLVAAVWLALTERGIFDQQTIARALGVSAALLGAQLAVFDDRQAWVGYLLTWLLVAVAVWLYVTRVDWPYVAIAVIAVTLVVPEMISDWTDDSLGAVGGVLVAGVTLLVASFAGYRLHRSQTD